MNVISLPHGSNLHLLDGPEPTMLDFAFRLHLCSMLVMVWGKISTEKDGALGIAIMRGYVRIARRHS